MILTVNNIGTRENPYYKIMEGKNEFCSTKSFENALLIQKSIYNETQKAADTPKFSLTYILDKINELKGIDLRIDHRQKGKIIFLRYIYCKIARDTGHTLEAIGFEIAREHSSITPALRRFNDYFETDIEFRKLYFEILNEL